MPKPKKSRKATTTASEPTPQTVQHRFTVTTDEREQVICAEYCAVGATGILALQTEEVMLAVFQPDHWRSCVRTDAGATDERDGEGEPDAEPKPVEDED